LREVDHLRKELREGFSQIAKKTPIPQSGLMPVPYQQVKRSPSRRYDEVRLQYLAWIAVPVAVISVLYVLVRYIHNFLVKPW
jgi:hypothetical protein